MQTTETFYIICKKGDWTKIMSTHTSKGILATGEISEAWTESNPTRLFFMLEEYSERFNGEWEVVRINEVKTIEHVAKVADKEMMDFYKSEFIVPPKRLKG